MSTILNQVNTAIRDMMEYHGMPDNPVAQAQPQRTVPFAPTVIVDQSNSWDWSTRTTVNNYENRDEDERNSDNAKIAAFALFALSVITAGVGAYFMRELEECNDLAEFEELSAQMQNDTGKNYGLLTTHFNNAVTEHKRIVTNNYVWTRNVTIIAAAALLGTAAAFTGFMIPVAVLATAGTITAVAFSALGLGYITFNAVGNCLAKKPYYHLTQDEKQILVDARRSYNLIGTPAYSAVPERVLQQPAPSYPPAGIPDSKTGKGGYQSPPTYAQTVAPSAPPKE
ncbi:MAG: hypothetical protein P0S94_05610 [Simkaniaceae bacterium]|nr:hypothetical protein [Simkaniaceae bacterium]